MSEDKPGNTSDNNGNPEEQHESRGGEVNWEREVLMNIAMASLQEQRLNRRWANFFKAVYLFLFFSLVYVMYIMASLSYKAYSPVIGDGKQTGHTALIELDTEIAAYSTSSADNLVTALHAAIKDKNTRGIIIRANSPGGSPVESSYVYDEIIRLRKKHPDIKIYTVVKDGCFSGCYYIASATHEIYANRSSLIGSIGVIHMSFGFPELMKKLGVEPRIIATGDNKAFLNQFATMNPKHVEHMKKILQQTHEIFKSDVIKGRQNRLKTDTPDLFTGLVWNAVDAKKIGLIDEFGSTGYVARAIIGAEHIKDFTHKEGWWKSLLGDVESSFWHKLQKLSSPWRIGAH